MSTNWPDLTCCTIRAGTGRRDMERLRSVDCTEVTGAGGWIRGTPAGADVPCGDSQAMGTCGFAESGMDASETGGGIDPSAPIPM